jgi:hypothetical protein
MSLSSQTFERSASNILRAMPNMLVGMTQDIAKVLAKNLKRFMEDNEPPLSQNELAKKCREAGTKVAQTSIGLMLNPDKRLPTKSGKLPSPTIAQIDAVARGLGKEAWQLMHPNPDQAPLSAKERALYDEAMASMRRLRALEITRS